MSELLVERELSGVGRHLPHRVRRGATPDQLHRPTETRVFRVAMALIALAILDDAFLHPEPGTTAGDHLVSGLVPVAIAGVLALAYPRLRPGLRATAALVCGVLAVTAGVVDGFRHVAVDRWPATTSWSCSPASPGSSRSAGADAVAHAPARRAAAAPLRPPGARRIAAAVVGFLVVFPVAFAITATHRARTDVASADLGRRSSG